ncbi:MAG: hypothetical protein ABIK68_13795 [bacterium]
MIRDVLRKLTMVIWRALFAQKPKPVKKIVKPRNFITEPEETEPSSGYLKREDFNRQKIDKHVEIILKRYEDLVNKTPLTADFMGEEIDYPKRRKRFFSFPKPVPDLNELTDEIERFSKGDSVSNPRKKIRKYLKYYPYDPELRALNGIQIYSDTMQSGLDEKKLDVMHESLVELGQAIHNGALSIFYVNWVIKIYVKYLELLQRKILAEYNQVSTNYHWQIQKIAEELHKLAIQVTSMLTIKGQLTGMSVLNSKLKGSAYIYDCISKEEIRGACLALEGDERKNVSVGKSPKHILWEIITIATFFARTPMFTKLVYSILTTIPDSSRVLILQKNLVATVMAVSEYQFSLSTGDLGKKIEAAHRLYTRCENVISQHLGHISPKRLYEVDPFLKAAWITKESNGLFEKEEYRKMLEKSMGYLAIVLENPDTVKGSFEIARQLQDDLHGIMMEYGWSLF